MDDLSRLHDRADDDSGEGNGNSADGETNSDSSTDGNEETVSDYRGVESTVGSSFQAAAAASRSIGSDDPNPLFETGSSGSVGADRIAQFRREKRLAMNRESARNRRKRKKMLIETLEQQNTELSRENRSLKLIRESLTTKARNLEHELAAARATIAQFQLAAASQLPNPGFATSTQPSTSAAMHPSLSLTGSDFGSQFDPLDRHRLRNLDEAEPIVPSNQNQIDIFTGRPRSNLQFASAAASHNPQFSDDAILRRHALDIQALSQASRDSALGSITNPQHLLSGHPMSHSIGFQAGLPGMRAGHGNTMSQPPNPFLGMGDLPIQPNIRLPDNWSQANMSLRADDASTSQQRILEELLRRSGADDCGDSTKKSPKYPPSES